MKRQAYGFRDQEFFKLKILGIHETKHALVGWTFISSPSDVAEERRLACEVVNRLNRLSSVRGRFVLEVCAYEWTVPPLVGHGEAPQLVVDEYMLRAEEAAFFVCILRSKMAALLSIHKQA
jgi:hypothetical protein